MFPRHLYAKGLVASCCCLNMKFPSMVPVHGQLLSSCWCCSEQFLTQEGCTFLEEVTHWLKGVRFYSPAPFRVSSLVPDCR